MAGTRCKRRLRLVELDVVSEVVLEVDVEDVVELEVEVVVAPGLYS